MIDRRALMARSALLAGAGALPAGAIAKSKPRALPPLIGEIERRTFDWFRAQVNPRNGLVPDREPGPVFCSIAAVGFALTAWGIGAARGWMTRTEARDLTLTTLRFFDTRPTGEAASGTAGYKGFFYHFLDMETGLRFGENELSSVDSTLLFLGMLFAGSWFDREDDPAEAEIRALAHAIVERADWPWFQRGGRAISMGWHPGKGFIAKNWEGYNEGMMVYILGLGAAAHPLPDGAWDIWTETYPHSWRGEGATRHLAFGPLFAHQYGPMWIDFRGIRDAVMRREGFDYFENSRRATYAQRAYATANPMKWRGYSKDVWGLTACDGPAYVQRRDGGDERAYRGYSARGPLGQPDEFDDGTIAPTAALGSIAFAPEIVVPCAEAMVRQHGARIYGAHGFRDAFNPTFRYPVEVPTGTIDPEYGWVAKDRLGIDQGPILGGIANARDDLVWRTMRKSPVIRRGLTRAGFTGGWLEG